MENFLYEDNETNHTINIKSDPIDTTNSFVPFLIYNGRPKPKKINVYDPELKKQRMFLIKQPFSFTIGFWYNKDNETLYIAWAKRNKSEKFNKKFGKNIVKTRLSRMISDSTKYFNESAYLNNLENRLKYGNIFEKQILYYLQKAKKYYKINSNIYTILFSNTY